MDVNKSDSFPVRFSGNNYALWEFQIRYFVQRKGLLAYLDGTAPAPTISDETKETLAAWRSNNARVVRWLINSMESRIALTLPTFTSAADIWAYLEKTYSKVRNSSRIFEIEYELAKLSQGDRDIRSFYVAATDLWAEQDLLSSSSTISPAAYQVVLQERKRTRVLSFLTKLRPEFETMRAQAIANNVTDIDQVLAGLIQAETLLNTQTRSPNNGRLSVSVSKGAKCHHCNETGHIQTYCKKRNICNYCRKSGHIISDCRILKFRMTSTTDDSQTASTTSDMIQTRPSVASSQPSRISSSSSSSSSQTAAFVFPILLIFVCYLLVQLAY
ncbi:hypothetical protein LINGRAHAP2_LOCUS28367 [Linum grandiflorum]